MQYIIAIAIIVAVYYYLKNRKNRENESYDGPHGGATSSEISKSDSRTYVEDKINEPVKQKATPRQYTRENFQFAKMLYEGVYVQLGWFDTQKGRIYSVAFGYPDCNGKFEYVLISNSEFFALNMQPERQQWKDKDEAMQWKSQHVDGHQVLCNEFDSDSAAYKPSFTDDEIIIQ